VFGFSNIKLETIYGIESVDSFMGIWDFFGVAGEVIGTVNLSFSADTEKKRNGKAAREKKPDVPILNIVETEKQPDIHPKPNEGEK
jgi:hypothetical protein